jgi:hypothetical protein
MQNLEFLEKFTKKMSNVLTDNKDKVVVHDEKDLWFENLYTSMTYNLDKLCYFFDVKNKEEAIKCCIDVANYAMLIAKELEE